MHVILVGHGRLRVQRKALRHIATWHVWVLRHARAPSLGRKVLVGRFLRRLDLVAAIHAILVTSSGFGCVQTSLENISKCA
jgi:hypothetical protein